MVVYGLKGVLIMSEENKAVKAREKAMGWVFVLLGMGMSCLLSPLYFFSHRQLVNSYDPKILVEGIIEITLAGLVFLLLKLVKNPAIGASAAYSLMGLYVFVYSILLAILKTKFSYWLLLSFVIMAFCLYKAVQIYRLRKESS